MTASLLKLCLARLDAATDQLADSVSDFDSWAGHRGNPLEAAFDLYLLNAANEKRTRSEQLRFSKTRTIHPEMAAKVADFLPETRGEGYRRVGRPRETYKTMLCVAAFYEAWKTERFKGAAATRAASRLGIPDQIDAIEKADKRFRRMMGFLRAKNPDWVGLVMLELIHISDFLKRVETDIREAAGTETRERFASRHVTPISAKKFAPR